MAATRARRGRAERRAACQIGIFCSAVQLCSICSISYLVGGTSGPETVPLAISGGGTPMFQIVRSCFILFHLQRSRKTKGPTRGVSPSKDIVAQMC